MPKRLSGANANHEVCASLLLPWFFFLSFFKYLLSIEP